MLQPVVAPVNNEKPLGHRVDAVMMPHIPGDENLGSQT